MVVVFEVEVADEVVEVLVSGIVHRSTQPQPRGTEILDTDGNETSSRKRDRRVLFCLQREDVWCFFFFFQRKKEKEIRISHKQRWLQNT